MAMVERIPYTSTIRDMPLGERPRERLKKAGPAALSNVELLAILLRTGVTGEGVVAMASRLITRFQGLAGLARASYSELCAEHGISEAKASQLLAALGLGRRYASLQPEETPVITSPQDVANLLMGEMSYLAQEHLRVVLLNTKNQVVGISQVYVGNVNSSVIRSAEVVRPAVRQNCPAFIVVHNHPSGDPTPSDDDIAVTRQLADAATLLDIEMLDHVVIGSGNRWVSMKDKGLGF